jgi:hypothetical protein
MRAASERRRVESSPLEHAFDGSNVTRLATMRSTSDGQFFRAQPISLGRTRLDHYQGLQGLDRRTRIDRPLDIAERDNGLAVRIYDRNRAAMAAFDAVAAHDVDEDRINHS